MKSFVIISLLLSLFLCVAISPPAKSAVNKKSGIEKIELKKIESVCVNYEEINIIVDVIDKDHCLIIIDEGKVVDIGISDGPCIDTSPGYCTAGVKDDPEPLLKSIPYDNHLCRSA